MSKMDTVWQVSKESGDLLIIHSGKDYWTNVFTDKQDFPMDVDEVKCLLNKAFQIGAEAKLSEIQALLGIK